MLADYTYRQYGGLLCGFYDKGWEMCFGRLHVALEKGNWANDITQEKWFKHDWTFVLQGLQAKAPLKLKNVNLVFLKAMDIVKKQSNNVP